MFKTSRMRVSLCVLFLLTIAGTFPLFAGGGKAIKGSVVQIGHWWGAFDTETYQPRNDTEEQLLEYRRKIQADNGITIREVEVAGWGEMQQAANSRIMAGNKEISAFILPPAWAYTLYKQGLLYPLSDSSVKLTNRVPVKGEKTAYNPISEELFTFNGKQYAFSPGTGAGSWSGQGVYFNKRLFREARIDPELPYNMQRDGTWTWENFLNICKQLTRDVNNDGIIDIYAGADNSQLAMFVISNNAQYVGKNAQGKFVNTTNTPGFIEAMHFYKRLIDEGVFKMQPEGSAWDWHFADFYQGKVAIILDAEWRKGMLGDMTDDWGFVFPPKGPRAANYRVGVSESVYVVPHLFSPKEVDTILTAIDLWNVPVDDPNAWKTGQYSFYRDRRAVDETLTMMGDPKYTTFLNHTMIPGLNTGDFDWNIRGIDDPAQLIEMNVQYWDSLIDEANE